MTWASLTSYIDGIFETADAHVADSELKLGWPLFDKLFGGVPHADAFISIPGKPNQGKSSWLANVAHRLVDNNDDVIVLYHTVDDAMRWFLPRLFGSKYGIASEHFYKAGYHLNNNTLVKARRRDQQGAVPGRVRRGEEVVQSEDGGRAPAGVRRRHAGQQRLLSGDAGA